MAWWVRSFALDRVECQQNMNTGDLLIVDGGDAAIVVRHRLHGVLVWTNACRTIPLEDFLERVDLVSVRFLRFDTRDAVQCFVAAFDSYMARACDAAATRDARDMDAIVQLVARAGGTAAVPRAECYSELEHAVMCRVSPAYACVHTYIGIGVAVSIKPQNLYDFEDLHVHGALDDSLFDGVELTKDVFFCAN